jgi:hypothetical protein
VRARHKLKRAELEQGKLAQAWLVYTPTHHHLCEAFSEGSSFSEMRTILNLDKIQKLMHHILNSSLNYIKLDYEDIL